MLGARPFEVWDDVVGAPDGNDDVDSAKEGGSERKWPGGSTKPGKGVVVPSRRSDCMVAGNVLMIDMCRYSGMVWCRVDVCVAHAY